MIHGRASRSMIIAPGREMETGGLSGVPLIIGGLVLVGAVSAAGLMLAAARVIQAYNSGKRTQAVRESAQLIARATQAKTDGEITQSDFDNILSTLQTAIPEVKKKAVETFFDKHGATILAGALTALIGTVLISVIMKR